MSTNTPNHTNHVSLINLLANRIACLIHYEPVLNNIIAIVMCIILACLIYQTRFFPTLMRYHTATTVILKILIIWQVLKSAPRSLLLPLLLLFTSGSILLLQQISPALSGVPVQQFQVGMLIGVIGIAVSIFFIR